MKLLTKNEEGLTIQLTKDELRLIANALGETLNAIPDWELHPRTGSSPDEVSSLQVELRTLFRSLL